MAIARDDRWVADAQGRALSGAQVYWCTQPASTAVNPPSPLAMIYSDTDGDELTQPVLTDGFGHAFAYMDPAVLYTVVVWHPLFGANPVVLVDQSIGGGGGSGGGNFFAGTLDGTIDGTNTVFTLTNNGTPIGVTPTSQIVWLNFPLIEGLGYMLGPSEGQVTFANPPQPAVGGSPADAVYAQGTFA